MWSLSPDELANAPAKGRQVLRCTAEHLIARCDGGRDEATNIVAACERCNHTRHQRKHPPVPEVYRADVRKRIARGGWHHRWVHDLGLITKARSEDLPSVSLTHASRR
ncbi:HNH endonuclease [Sphaerotilus uruguayifluvii]|uniref:HNH endonuclease n=1 Tax=Sphaerotilus uruguayifluvii TaxID=2735897 RepID=UPI00336ADD10